MFSSGRVRRVTLCAAVAALVGTAAPADAASSVTHVSTRRAVSTPKFQVFGVNTDATLVLWGDGAQVYLYSTKTRKHELISATAAGKPGNGSSEQASMSQDARYVAFVSKSSNLVTGDRNVDADYFLRDRKTKRTVRLNVDSRKREVPAAESKGASVSTPHVSGDGSTVLFSTFGDMTGGRATPSPRFAAGGQILWAYSTATRSVEPAAVDPQGRYERVEGRIPFTSNRNGRIVAFETRDPLTADDPEHASPNAGEDIYVIDRVTRSLKRVPVDYVSDPSMTLDDAGLQLLFHGRVTAGEEATWKILQVATGAISEADGYAGPKFMPGFSPAAKGAGMSANGRYVFFQSGYGAFTAGAADEGVGGAMRWYRRDVKTGEIVKVLEHKRDDVGSADDHCLFPNSVYWAKPTPDGRFFGVVVQGARLAPSDPDCGYSDVYLVKV